MISRLPALVCLATGCACAALSVRAHRDAVRLDPLVAQVRAGGSMACAALLAQYCNSACSVCTQNGTFNDGSPKYQRYIQIAFNDGCYTPSNFDWCIRNATNCPSPQEMQWYDDSNCNTP